MTTLRLRLDAKMRVNKLIESFCTVDVSPVGMGVGDFRVQAAGPGTH